MSAPTDQPMTGHNTIDQPTTESVPIKIVGSSGTETSGMLTIRRWRGKSRLRRAVMIQTKIGGCILVLCSVALFIHPLILPSITTFILSLICGPFVFSYFLGQETTFLFANGKCPYCAFEGKLNRYIWITVSEEFTLLCPQCGQSFHGHLIQPIQSDAA